MSEERKETKNIFSALFLIIAGIILLLNNFGVLSWTVWLVLFRFWPLLLIIWGIEIAFSRDSFLYLLSFLVVILVFLYSVALVNQPFDNWLKRQVPFWEKIEEVLPGQNLPQTKNKVFRCDPTTGKCSTYYR